MPGSTYERYSCYNGEITVDNCYDGRQKVCVESNVPTSDGKVFRNAACKLNAWQRCYDQKNETSCLNREVRDCKWVPSINDEKTFPGCVIWRRYFWQGYKCNSGGFMFILLQ